LSSLGVLVVVANAFGRVELVKKKKLFRVMHVTAHPWFAGGKRLNLIFKNTLVDRKRKRKEPKKKHTDAS
jgi:hypothetical protein